MNTWTDFSIVAPTLLLLVAAVLDIKTGKFPNWLFLASFAAGAVWLFVHAGLGECMKNVVLATLVLLALSPLFFLKVLGAGDIKLLASFSLFTGLAATANVFVYSLFWGLLIGLLRVVLNRDTKNFFQSFVLRNPQVKSQKIPYTVAILIGWFSFLTVGGLV